MNYTQLATIKQSYQSGSLYQEKKKSKMKQKFERKKVSYSMKYKYGKTYHWCVMHDMWTLHKPEEWKLETEPPKYKDNFQLKEVLTSVREDEESLE